MSCVTSTLRVSGNAKGVGSNGSSCTVNKVDLGPRECRATGDGAHAEERLARRCEVKRLVAVELEVPQHVGIVVVRRDLQQVCTGGVVVPRDGGRVVLLRARIADLTLDEHEAVGPTRRLWAAATLGCDGGEEHGPQIGDRAATWRVRALLEKKIKNKKKNASKEEGGGRRPSCAL
eukprot:7179343-Prymnesium_polylepis.1